MKSSDMKKSELIYLLIIFVVVSVINFYNVQFVQIFPYLPWWSPVALSVVMGLVVILRIIEMQVSLNQREYEFINVVTHTFRTPVTVIKWSIDGLRKSEHAVEILDDTNQIESSNERIIALLDTLTGFSSLVNEDKYTFGAVSFREMVEETLKKYGPKIREKDISLTIDIPGTVPLTTGDPKRLQFVIEVLIQNAMTYTPKGGHIFVAIYFEKDSLTMIVQDSGIGITKKDMKHLFVKFFRSHTATTTETQGMGLGLYVAKQIIARHHGKIWAESPGQDKGSTFYVKLKLDK